MTFKEMAEAIQEANETIRAAKYQVREMAELISGNLRMGNVRGSVLLKLKQELKQFNGTTWRWKKGK